MSRQSLDLLGGSGATATGSQFNWGGGDALFTVACSGFNGATIKLQYLGPDATSWIDAGTETTLTANGGGIASLPSGGVRAAIITATPSAVAYAKLTSV